MTLEYGFVKCKLVSDPELKASRRRRETQYHLHVKLQVATSGGSERWDCAINVGTNDSDDLLKYILVYDFHHPLRKALSAVAPGYSDLTGRAELPALDFLRSDVLAETGSWRDSDVMDGSDQPEPVASLLRLLRRGADQRCGRVCLWPHLYERSGNPRRPHEPGLIGRFHKQRDGR